MDNQEVRYSFTSEFQGLAKGVNSAINLLKKYSSAMKKADTDSSMKQTKKNFDSLKSSLQGLGTSFNNTSKQAKSLTSSMKNLSSIGSSVQKAFSAITGVALGNWFSDAVTQSIKFVENLNLFKVAMGDSVDQGMKFVDQMSEIYGMDPSNLYRYAGYFYQLTDAIGMTDDASSTLSLSLTKASNDIASLFNVPVEQVVNNLASGLQGMSRSVRKYGMDIRSVTLQQTALNYGITQQVETMSEADRQALRYLTMMEQVKNATSQVVDETVNAAGVMGDFARNIETPANQLRIFKEQVSQLGRAIGNFFIPILSRLLPILNGIIMAIRTVLTFLSALTGFSLNFGGASSGADKTAKAIGGIGDAASGASKAAKELRKTLAPFDEINLLQKPQETSGGGGGGGGGVSSDILDPRLADAVSKMSLGLEDIQMKANKVRDALLEFFGFDYVEEFNPETGEFEKKLQWFSDRFEANLINKFPQWSNTITALFDNWSKIIDGFKNLFQSIGTVFDAVKQKVKDFIASLNLDERFANAIKNLADNLNGLAQWITDHSDQIANFILLIGGVVAAFKGFNLVKGYLTPIIATVTKIAPIVVKLTSFVAPILAIVTAVALLYQNSESFADAFRNLFGTIVDSFKPIADSVVTLVSRIWESMKQLWEEHLQPMIAGIGDAMAPILNTLSVLWETLSSLFQSIMEMLGTMWETVVAPILGALADAITGLMGIIKQLWEEVIGPVIENILESLPDLFDGTIKPVIEKVSQILGGLIELILALLTNVLMPIISWLIDVLGPTIRNVVNAVWNAVEPIIISIMGIIDGVLLALKGVIDFLVGVFTGDWQRAWLGIKEIFAGIWNAIVKVLEAVINTIIGAVNAAIGFLWGALQSFVNGILSVVNRVASVLGYSISLSWGSPPPAIGSVTIPTVAMAAGGVVTGPTNAIIGEGRYDEAVIPLGNSPQMSELVNTIADRVNSPDQVVLLREQNQLLRQILEASNNSVGIRDLTRSVTRIQKQEIRAGGL